MPGSASCPPELAPPEPEFHPASRREYSSRIGQFTPDGRSVMRTPAATEYEVKLFDGNEKIQVSLRENPPPGSRYRYKGKWWLVLSVTWLTR
jgi:hypothetical protein